jgi:predicted glutamine amidotransferase
MCRWMAFLGPPIFIEDLFFDVDHSLIDMAIGDGRKQQVNGDGFGVGFWTENRSEPSLYRSVMPAWGDANLLDLAHHVKSGMFMGHVRAAPTGSPIQETNCHPFRWGQWLFAHNGQINRFDEIKKELLDAIDAPFVPQIKGSTDSELMFYLTLSHGLVNDPFGACLEMIKDIEEIAGSEGIMNPVEMTVGILGPLGGDRGDGLFVKRYSSDVESPTLYATTDPKHLLELNPTLEDPNILPSLKKGSILLVASEPLGDDYEDWEEIDEGEARAWKRNENGKITEIDSYADNG